MYEKTNKIYFFPRWSSSIGFCNPIYYWLVHYCNKRVDNKPQKFYFISSEYKYNLGVFCFSSWYFFKTLYIVEIHDEKIIFKGFFHRYIIPFSQIQDIERRKGQYKGTAYFVLKVKGYDPNKVFYPFEFDCNKKTQELAQKLWVDIQLRHADE